MEATKAPKGLSAVNLLIRISVCMQSVGSSSLNRREMLRLGAAGAGGLLLSSAASSQGLAPSILTQPMAPIVPAKPTLAAPVAPTAPVGIDPSLFQKAKAALDSHRIAARDSIGIVDFSLASRDP